MPAEDNSLASEAGARSTAKGDVPEALRRRYFLDPRGGAGVGFYVDARTERPAFRDEGRKLVAARNDPNAIRDMALIAQHRGWSVVVVRGEREFRREAWLIATASGLEVRGYTPTERDQQALERRRRDRERERPPETEADPHAARIARRNLRVVEAVIGARIADPQARERILASARSRLAAWLERGAQPRPLTPDISPHRQASPRRERQRG